MILLEKRKAIAACRKAFIESVYGEGERLYESVFADAAEFEAFMNTLVQPKLGEGWQLSGDVAVDDEGVTHDDVILYKESEKGDFCVISASIVDGKPWIKPTYTIECSTAAKGYDTYSSDDLDDFIPVYNSMAKDESCKEFNLGGEEDPLKALMAFVGKDENDRDSLLVALANKNKENKEEQPVENEPETNEEASENEEEANHEQEVDELITDEVKKEAEEEMNSWLS